MDDVFPALARGAMHAALIAVAIYAGMYLFEKFGPASTSSSSVVG